MRGDVNLPALKWKQPTELTLDIAIGGPIKRDPLTTSFIAYLDTEVTEGWLEPVTTASRVVLPSHRPFCCQRMILLFSDFLQKKKVTLQNLSATKTARVER